MMGSLAFICTLPANTCHCRECPQSSALFAEVSAKEIIALNHGMDPNNIEEKQTILIPAGKLSSRDKEILAGLLLHALTRYDAASICPYI